MKITGRSCLAVAALAIVGCKPLPATPDAFRQDRLNDPNDHPSMVQSKPFAQLADFLQSKGAECFEGRSTQTGSTPGPYGPVSESTWKAFHVHFYRTPSTFHMWVQKEQRGSDPFHVIPMGGTFLLLVDVTPVTKATSKIQFSNVFSGDELRSAVIDWVTGKNLGCPDLSGL